jgi:hypothetical protein
MAATHFNLYWLFCYLKWKDIGQYMLLNLNTMKQLAKYMNTHPLLNQTRVDFDVWKGVARLLASMRAVWKLSNEERRVEIIAEGWMYETVQPLRGGCGIYGITNCCSLNYLSLLDHSPLLDLEAKSEYYGSPYFCKECWDWVFNNVWHWDNLVDIRLQVNFSSRRGGTGLHHEVMEHIWWLRQYDQLKSLSLGDILVSEEDDLEIVTSFGSLTTYDRHTHHVRENIERRECAQAIAQAQARAQAPAQERALALSQAQARCSVCGKKTEDRCICGEYFCCGYCQQGVWETHGIECKWVVGHGDNMRHV